MGQFLQTQINWFRRQLFWDTLERRILPKRQAQNELLALLGKEIPTTRTHLTCRADSVVLHHRAVMGEVIGLGNYSRTLIFWSAWNHRAQWRTKTTTMGNWRRCGQHVFDGRPVQYAT